jgi:hypothetical protein
LFQGPVVSDHFKRGYRGLLSFVSIWTTCSIQGLLEGIYGQHTDYDRNGHLHIEFLYACSNGLADILKMRRSTPDHTPKGNDGIQLVGRVACLFKQAPAGKGQFKSTWHPVGLDARNAMQGQLLPAPLLQPANHLCIPFGVDQSDTGILQWGDASAI